MSGTQEQVSVARAPGGSGCQASEARATRRRPLDLYETGAAAVRALLEHVEIQSPVLEPCAGPGAIVRALRGAGIRVEARDVDPQHGHLVDDARTAKAGCFSWVVTNPPFNQAFEIARNFVEQGRPTALLLRLSWLEPTRERGGWLEIHPPKRVIVLPRYSFTGDGRHDSVTCAWCVWGCQEKPAVIVSARPAQEELPW